MDLFTRCKRNHHEIYVGDSWILCRTCKYSYRTTHHNYDILLEQPVLLNDAEYQSLNSFICNNKPSYMTYRKFN